MTTINTSNIKKIFEDNGVRLIQADWTNKDPEILKFISNYGKYGIPVNIIYSSKFNEGILLQKFFHRDILKEEFRKVINEN